MSGNTITIGQVRGFRRPYHVTEYGKTATIVAITDAEPSQATPGIWGLVTLVDMRTVNGTDIQWRASQVHRDTRLVTE